MNEVGVASALQSVLGFEIDAQNNILYILDQGKVNYQPAIPGSIKLVAIDLSTREVLFSHPFPADIADLAHSFLNDVVIDRINGFAYITDSGVPSTGVEGVEAGLIALDLNTFATRRWLSSLPTVQPNSSLWIHINDQPVTKAAPMMTGADCIRLTPDTTTLYYCALTSHYYHMLPTALLRDFNLTDADLEGFAVTYPKFSCSDGLAIDSAGNLFATSLEGSGIHGLQGGEVIQVLATNSTSMQWPDTIGFDHEGSLVFVSNQLQNFVQDELSFGDPSEMNFRIWSIYTGTDSYLDNESA